jgi:PAS domain S-box-containing protein
LDIDVLNANLKYPGLWDRLVDLFIKDGKKNGRAIGAVCFVILAPILFLSAYSSLTTYRHLTQLVWSQRFDLAHLTALTLQEKLSRLSDLSVSLASRVRFRQLVLNGKWEEAIRILANVPRDFPQVERAFLTDLKGTITADEPVIPELRGRNFADQDWYRGVSKNWMPYISDVYKGSGEPRLNVIAAALPIKTDDNQTVAILVLQVNLKSLVAWSESVDTNGHENVLVVDKRGNLVAYPGINLQSRIRDISAIPAVRKALQGLKGVETSADPGGDGDQLYAYYPVAGYGWGVVVQQPVRIAYQWRDRSLAVSFITYGLILLFSCGLTYLILGILIRIKQSEENHARLAVIVESSDDAIFSQTLEGEILTWNKGAVKVYGYMEAEVVGRNFRLLVPTEQTKETDELLESIRHGDVVERYETVRQRKDGSLIDLSLTMSPIKNSSGKIIGASAIGRDITHLKKLRNELREKNRTLEEQYQVVQDANRLKSEFLANMSHELRTPLNAIIGFSQMMQDGKVGAVSPDHREYLGDILASGRRLLELINDILDLARLESGRMEFHPEAVQLSQLIEQVRVLLNKDVVSKRLSIETEVAPQVENLLIDAAKFKQVLYNYLSNAIKFTPAGGHIAIRVLAMESEHFRLEVQDSGIGIPPERFGELFTEFKQLDGGLNKRHQGTGLGLALTKKIVEAQNGRVGVEKSAGQGSVFYAILPTVASGAATLAKIDISIPIMPPGVSSVLVVANNENHLSWLSGALSQSGYFVDSAKSAADAIAKIHKQSYAAVLLDLVLPDGGGWEILRAIHGTVPNQATPVIVVGLVPEKGVATGFQIRDYLVKPIPTSGLLEALKRAGISPGRASRPVLVIDDDPTALKFAEVSLKAGGYEVICHSNGASALEDREHADYAAVVLELLMAEMNGFDFLDCFHGIDQYRNTPVIFWTNMDATAAQLERLRCSAQNIALKNRDGIHSLLRKLPRRVQAVSPAQQSAMAS